MAFVRSIIFSIFITNYVRSQGVWDTRNNLQPVHGLYVKPSIDGTTGDLYVAATEEDGINSQWLTDQPINFLSAAMQTEPKAAPISFTSSLSTSSSPEEETVTTQKRAILTSPPIKYKYSVPTTGSEGSIILPYPYAVPASETTEESNVSPCANTVPYYSPIQYFYPHMLAAIAKAFNSYKDPSSTEESTAQAQPAAAWSHTYTYPFQFLMVDPSAWAKQSTTSTSTSKTSGTESS